MAEPLPPDDDPPARRPMFERPLLWLAVLVAGVVVAVSLSFVAEKTDVSGTPGDVGHYCQQVAVIKRTTPLALGNGAAGNIDEAAAFVWGLTSLERVAPDNVRPDVHEVLAAAKDVYAALTVADPEDPASARALAVTVQRDEARSEDAIDRMKEYTQEACGVDLSPPSTSSTTTSPSTTTLSPTTSAPASTTVAPTTTPPTTTP
jgi:hypothetical protein